MSNSYSGSTAPRIPTQGDISFTPHYDTTYGSSHGYNERELYEKSTVWKQQYQYHAPTAQTIRQLGVARNGYYELPRTKTMNSDVQELIQARTGLLGADNKFTNVNSLTVSCVYGRDNPPPGTNNDDKTATADDIRHGNTEMCYHDHWLQRTIPTDKTHQPLNNVHDKHRKWNSRTNNYESEYVANFCEAQVHQSKKWQTRDPNWKQESIESFEQTCSISQTESKENDNNLLSLPLATRCANEHVDTNTLHTMKYPVQRKQYGTLQQTPNIQEREQAYPFDMRTHIDTMLPDPLFKDMRHGERRPPPQQVLPYDTFVCK